MVVVVIYTVSEKDTVTAALAAVATAQATLEPPLAALRPPLLAASRLPWPAAPTKLIF